MDSERLEIDIKAIARKALATRQPGEDLDEAILRACKTLYGDKGPSVFGTIQALVQREATAGKISPEAALKELESGRVVLISSTIMQGSMVSGEDVSISSSLASIEDLPEEVRNQVADQLKAAGAPREAKSPGFIRRIFNFLTFKA